MSSYVPELNRTPELEPEELQYFQKFIGMIRWDIAIGRVDILFEVSILSQYQALPWEGHLEKVLHILDYLKKNPSYQFTWILSYHIWTKGTSDPKRRIFRSNIEGRRNPWPMTCQV